MNRWSALLSLAALVVVGCSDDPDEPFPTGQSTPTEPGSSQVIPGSTRDEREPNNDVAGAEAVSLGEAINAKLAPGDSDFFRLAIPESFSGHKITISVADHDGLCFTGVDPWLQIRAEGGSRQLYFVEDVYEHYCPAVSFVPDPGADYYAVVGTDWGLAGDYQIRFVDGGLGTVSGVIVAGEAGRMAGRSPGGAARLAPGEVSQAEVVDGDLMVALSPGISPADGLERLRRHLGEDLRMVRPVMGGRYLLLSADPPRGMSRAERRRWTLDRVRRAAAVPGVSAAEPNRLLQPLTTPNDPGIVNQWHYAEEPGMNARAAWDLTTGDPDVVVAIIDTGHDADHPDLVSKVARGGYDFITDLDNAQDGDGPDSNPADAIKNGHGTHVAGTVAADTDNNLGVAGVGWETTYLPLRVCGVFGCTEADICEAVYYAAGYETVAGPGQRKARAAVINMSLGGHDACSHPMQQAVAAASLRGVAVVVAAGNSADITEDYSPASCDDVIAVAALNQTGNLASFSNFGEATDVAAPGVEILSTWEDGQYALLQGTSMASPHVAGLAALLKSVDASFSTDTVQSLMVDTAAGTRGCDGRGGCGAGLVDAAAAVELALTTPGDAPRQTVVVEAVDVDDPSRKVSTLALDGAFSVVDLPAGTWQLRAGEDNDGDLSLESGEPLDATFTITSAGEDYDGVVIQIP